MEIRNFGKNVAFQPESFFAPQSEEEVLDILHKCKGRRVRVVGRLHSWSEAPRSDDVLLDLRHLNSVQVERRGDEVRAIAGAGCQIKHLLSEVERQAGVTLPSVGLIDQQTIAGATATGTHGSGKHSLAHYVDEVRIATYDAETREPVVRTIVDGDPLQSARCSLGCLGVILSIGMRCRPQYRVEEHLRMHKKLCDVLDAENDYPLQQFFMVPWNWKFLGQHRREVDRKRSLTATLYRAYWFLAVDVSLHLYLQLIIKVLGWRFLVHHFYGFISPLMIVRRWRAVDKSQRMLTMKHELFRHIEIEVFVKRSRLEEVLQFARALIEFADGDSAAFDEATWERLTQLGLSDSLDRLLGTYTHHYAICVRKVLADSTHISMASSDDEPYYAISFISYARASRRESFLRFAGILAEATSRLFGARPHWGKVCPIDSQLVEELYPKLGDFRRVCDSFDPAGVFRNDWTAKLIFGECSET